MDHEDWEYSSRRRPSRSAKCPKAGRVSFRNTTNRNEARQSEALAHRVPCSHTKLVNLPGTRLLRNGTPLTHFAGVRGVSDTGLTPVRGMSDTTLTPV